MNKPCIPGCASRWLTLVQGTILKNDNDINLFTIAIKTELVQGRSKNRNDMLVGTSNYGKTFLLNPFKNILNYFVTPTKGTFN